jgi:hypothetical protein
MFVCCSVDGRIKRVEVKARFGEMLMAVVEWIFGFLI